ncbi:hypothetical protein GOP47_0023630 [Adiantum capillus-veneris]|uniref:Uncharacterized protein n=1 Tax=Adiantum capillus-veneris TaxID=13818 RepID=A0A9D4U4V7_ADICA|nr:hypothetical protein GOP47_0023630 [Adiantum capillus-veneris]
MKEPLGRRRYLSLLRKRANANWLDLKSAALTPKFKLSYPRKHRMSLRRKNSFQGSKLPRSLRSSAPHNNGSEVSSAPVARHDREEGEAFPVNRRITRAMDEEEIKRTTTIDAPRSRILKGSSADKIQKQGKHTRRAASKNFSILEDKMETDNASNTMKLKHQEHNTTDNKVVTHLYQVADITDQRYDSKSPTGLDTNQASKSSSEARSLSKSSRKQISEGVTTRQKASSTAPAQPPFPARGDANLSQDTKGNHSPGLINRSRKGGAREVDEKQKRTFSRGIQEEAEDRFRPGGAQRSADATLDQTSKSQLDSEDSYKGRGWPALLQHSRKRKTVNQVDDPRQLDSGKGRPPLGRSPRIATGQGPVTLTKLIESAVKLRRSKRKRSPTRSDHLSDHRYSQKGSKGVRGQFEDAAFQHAAIIEQGNGFTEEKFNSAHKVAENEMESNLEAFRIDPASNSCLVATNPTETGGRQMRPRPLDLEQPLLVLVEGLDEDYYEFDGGSFHKLLQQQPEVKSPSASQAKSYGSVRKSLHALDATGGKAESIVIPSFRMCMEPMDSLQHSTFPYILPDSYIKAGSTIENHQAEYDLDEEDEEWLSKYNQSLSPSSAFSVDQFEKIIDLLEKKAADANGISSITESLEEDQEPMPEECCICNGGENSANNLVYQCESCHILVHQSCYGIKKGFRNEKKRRKWNCKKCKAIAEGEVPADVSCSLCCKQGGALKPSTEPHRWAHVVCALYTNETYFVYPDAMEPIEGLNAADTRAKRQRRRCCLCGVREGSAERCSIPGCKSVFHVSCGVTQGASFELQHSNQQVTSVRVYCPRHALEVFGSAKGRSSESEKQTLFRKVSSQEDGLCDTEQGLKARKQSEISLMRRSKKEASSQGKNHKRGDYGHSAENREKLNFEHNWVSITNQDGVDESKRRERADVQLNKGMAMNGVSAEEACAALAEESKTSANLMEGVYLYWASKRAKQGGPLLHRIQQEHAAKQFGIFNSDDESGLGTDSVSDGISLKCHSVDMKVVAARQQLQRLRELSLLVVEREKLKLEIFSLDQDIIKVGIEALNATGSRQLCSSCKESHLSLLCAVCNKAICMSCLIKESKYTSWQDFLKHSNCICPDCEQQNIQMHIELACKPYGNGEEDGLAGSPMMRALNEECGSDAALENSQLASHNKAFILLPRSDCSHQDKLATQAFWEHACPKMVLLLDLLKDPV